MEIAVYENGEIKVLHIEGALDGQSAPTAEAALSGLVSAGASKILINMEHLSYISSAGLRVLLIVAKQLKKQAGKVCICNANPTVMEVFEISGFTSIFSISPTQEEALARF